MNNNLIKFRAIDTQTIPGRFLHLSGTSLTTDKHQSWLGTKAQFHNICELYEWDNLKAIPAKLLD